jgi:dTDP-glucose 4,6-dehydratase|tara:strand:+ start:189 stop:1136 length:948 start_codon:yes stop_codon:yes gene_type:complete
MKILVTGVLGVIGSKLEEILTIRGHQVFGVDLYHTNRNYGHGLGKVKDDNYFRCDIGEFRQIEQVIEYVKPDLVYNCAAEFGRWNGENFYEKVWKSNVIGMKHIIRLQEKHGFKLVHCSSSEVYGDYEGVMYEDVLAQTPIIQMNDYAMSKRVNEMQVHNSRSQFGTETVMVRFFNTYGPGEWYHPFRSVNCLFTYNLLHNKPITVFKGHSRTSTYIYDSVRTLANIANNFIDGETYNIASDQEHTIENLAELLVKYTKADPALVDYREHSEVLTTKHKHVDASKSVRDLDHKNTVSLEEGVWETVQWMKEHYRL